MKPKKAPSSADAWDIPACEALIRDLWALRESMLRNEVRLASWLRQADATHTASATNLAHYLALRRHDLRSLQEQLARMGLSSLGRAATMDGDRSSSTVTPPSTAWATTSSRGSEAAFHC